MKAIFFKNEFDSFLLINLLNWRDNYQLKDNSFLIIFYEKSKKLFSNSVFRRELTKNFTWVIIFG